jgi:DNA replication and repair protein RecF
VIIKELKISNLRCIKGLDLELGSGLHVFLGANGAGKTSILEAVAVLGSGRSFRSNQRNALISSAADHFSLFARTQWNGVEQSLGIRRDAKQSFARIDGSDAQLSELVRCMPVWVIEPGSHELISGGSERRRSLLDWLMFHVEHQYGRMVAGYERALKQRNAVLKQEQAGAQLQAWNNALVEFGQQIESVRARYYPELFDRMREFAERLLPELGEPQVSYKRGWPDDQEMGEALLQRTQRDMALGYTSAGPHRADWQISFALASDKHHLSRGQQKSTCFAAVFAALKCFASLRNTRAILCMDDLFSELDVEHQARSLLLASELADQILVTGIDGTEALKQWPGQKQVYQVVDGDCKRSSD